MKERPILFSGPMVRPIIEGRKTQTRRVIKMKPSGNFLGYIKERLSYWFQNEPLSIEIKCPFGVPGDRLWVRETYFWNGINEDQKNNEHCYYRADGEIQEQVEDSEGFTKWNPSIFMPRWASRITLEIENVRVERLQEITEEDALKEGCEIGHGLDDSSPFFAKGQFKQLWDTINGPRSWSENPWVWVIEFKRVER